MGYLALAAWRRLHSQKNETRRPVTGSRKQINKRTDRKTKESIDASMARNDAGRSERRPSMDKFARGFLKVGGSAAKTICYCLGERWNSLGIRFQTSFCGHDLINFELAAWIHENDIQVARAGMKAAYGLRSHGLSKFHFESTASGEKTVDPRPFSITDPALDTLKAFLHIKAKWWSRRCEMDERITHRVLSRCWLTQAQIKCRNCFISLHFTLIAVIVVIYLF